MKYVCRNIKLVVLQSTIVIQSRMKLLLQKCKLFCKILHKLTIQILSMKNTKVLQFIKLLINLSEKCLTNVSCRVRTALAVND